MINISRASVQVTRIALYISKQRKIENSPRNRRKSALRIFAGYSINTGRLVIADKWPGNTRPLQKASPWL